MLTICGRGRQGLSSAYYPVPGECAAAGIRESELATPEGLLGQQHQQSGSLCVLPSLPAADIGSRLCRCRRVETSVRRAKRRPQSHIVRRASHQCRTSFAVCISTGLQCTRVPHSTNSSAEFANSRPSRVGGSRFTHARPFLSKAAAWASPVWPTGAASQYWQLPSSFDRSRPITVTAIRPVMLKF